MTGKHYGRRRLALAVQSRAYWPPLSSNVDFFIKQCKPYARCHRGGLCPTVVGAPCERVSIDITGPQSFHDKINLS